MSTYKDIFEAVEKGTVEDVRYFIEAKGVDVGVRDDEGYTPLHSAATKYEIEIVEYLISKGADVNAKSYGSRIEAFNLTIPKVTPLMWPLVNIGREYLIEEDIIPVFQCLISRGADVDAIDENGWTALHTAAHKNYLKVVQCLVQAGANINAKTKEGNTPLHFAASTKHSNVKVLEYLASHGADINAKEEDGYTPLHSAAAHSPDADILQCLISLGANVNAKTHKGSTPLYFADSTSFANSEEKKRILRNAGGYSSSGGGTGSSGCLVFITAIGTLLTSGICGLALFVSAVWKF